MGTLWLCVPFSRRALLSLCGEYLLSDVSVSRISSNIRSLYRYFPRTRRTTTSPCTSLDRSPLRAVRSGGSCSRIGGDECDCSTPQWPTTSKVVTSGVRGAFLRDIRELPQEYSERFGRRPAADLIPYIGLGTRHTCAQCARVISAVISGEMWIVRYKAL